MLPLLRRAASLVFGYTRTHSYSYPSELGAPMGTGVGGCLSRSRPRESVQECAGLGTPLPCGAGSRNVAGGLGQVIKELKCYLPPEPSCPFPAAWGQSCLGWRSRACPALNLGKTMLKAAPCFLHPRAGGMKHLPGAAGPEAMGRARSPTSEQWGTATCVCPSSH